MTLGEFLYTVFSLRRTSWLQRRGDRPGYGDRFGVFNPHGTTELERYGIAHDNPLRFGYSLNPSGGHSAYANYATDVLKSLKLSVDEYKSLEPSQWDRHDLSYVVNSTHVIINEGAKVGIYPRDLSEDDTLDLLASWGLFPRGQRPVPVVPVEPTPPPTPPPRPPNPPPAPPTPPTPYLSTVEQSARELDTALRPLVESIAWRLPDDVYSRFVDAEKGGSLVYRSLLALLALKRKLLGEPRQGQGQP